MKAAVITFPGSNCDKDIGTVLNESYGVAVTYVWHRDFVPDGMDLVVLPGGFSYGDYLRCGAMARFSPAMESVVDFANKGGKILGICNGFQILTEARLLPGALTNNLSLQYICKDQKISLPKSTTGFWSKAKDLELESKSILWPIAHGEGRYYAEPDILKQLEDEGRIVARYIENPNGSLNDIAGICSENGNIVGLMPHPERAMNPYTKLMDGSVFFDYFLKAI
jgi:phosphoribosylformylglycinamidine synthase